MLSHGCLCFVIELSRLFPGKSVVFSLSPGVDQVGDDEWWGHIENACSDSPDGVGDTLGDCASKGPLLEGGDVVLGGATNCGKLAEAFGQTCQ